MKIKSCSIRSIEGKGALEDLLSDENIVTKKMYIVPAEMDDHIAYIFYEEAEEQLAQEKDDLSKLEKVAQKLEKDEDYGKLKNSTQRSLYLLSQYSIPSGQATKVIELVNMRKIVIDSGLTRVFEKGVESGEIKVE